MGILFKSFFIIQMNNVVEWYIASVVKHYGLFNTCPLTEPIKSKIDGLRNPTTLLFLVILVNGEPTNQEQFDDLGR